jgi:hypothetical protein
VELGPLLGAILVLGVLMLEAVPVIPLLEIPVSVGFTVLSPLPLDETT